MSGGTKSRRVRLALLVALVLLGGGTLYAMMDAAERRHLESEFSGLARRDVDAMSAAFEVVQTRLLALGQLYASSKEVDADEFVTFVSGLPDLTGVQAYEWIPRVRMADRASFEAAAAAEGLVGFSIRDRDGGEFRESAEREEYAPVRFVWPLAGNEPAVGFDLWSNEARRTALHRARDTGGMVVTPPLTLVQERGSQLGVLVALPHYTNGAPRTTLEERRKNFVGYTLMVLRMGDFVEGVVTANRSSPAGLTVMLRYAGGAGQPSEIYTHRSRAAAADFSLARLPDGLVYARRLGPEHGDADEMGAERDLEAVVTPSSGFARRHSSGILPAALIGTSIITVLTVALLFLAEARYRINEDRSRLRLAEEQSRAMVADAANKSKSEFLSAMSHEIRTPMNGVLGMVEVLMQTSLKANQMEMARTIRQSALLLLSTINEILDFSKIEAGRFELDHDPACLEEVFEKACLLLGPMSQKRQVDLTIFVDPALSFLVNTDADRMRQLVINLLGNAIKFSSGMPRHGAAQFHAHTVTAVDGKRVLEFSVRDNGIGIPKEKLTVIFEPFRQVSGHTSRRHEGTGLGLAICRQIVDLMGGTISVESEVDVGTTVTVRVPLEVLAERPAVPPILKGVRCVVEGVDSGVAGAIRAYLADAGAQVVGCADASGFRPDCWVVDVGRTGPESNIEAALAHAAGSVVSMEIPGLVVLRGARRKVRPLGATRAQIDGTLLTRAQTVNAVAVLCGLGRSDDGSVGPVDQPAESPHDAAGGPVIPLRVATILVAEDNEVNQEVIRRQLTLLGYRFEIAATGTDALRRLGDREFSLLLTDLHMPAMDGYELTAKVREREAAQKTKRMPIVALTANALKSEAERCRTQGMDDYLSKPVGLAELGATLERWLGIDGLTLAKSARPAKPAPNEQPVDAAMRARFIEVLDASLREIRTAVAQGRWYDAGFHAHKLKSAAAAIQSGELAAACAKVEVAGLSRDSAGVQDGLPLLLESAERERSRPPSDMRA